MRRLPIIGAALLSLATSSAGAATGVDRGTLLIDGGVMYSAYGQSAGTYFARGIAEYLVGRHLGVRLDGFAQFTAPRLTESLLDLRVSGVALGAVYHFLPVSAVDPYVSLSAGATFTSGDEVRAAPSLAAAAGLNVHFGRVFLNAQAGYHLANLVLHRAQPALSDLRVQGGLGFTFDLAR
jgi:hypothetical protein